MAVGIGVIVGLVDRYGSLLAKLLREGRTEATQAEMDAATGRMDAADQSLEDALREAEERRRGDG